MIRLPKKNLAITDTRLLGYWHEDVPVYEVTSMYGLNQIVGYVKHINANEGTVLYRGEAHLHEKLIPSILHGNPTKPELKLRNKELSDYIKNVDRDPRMNLLLHFDENTSGRYFYKQYVIESMFQHYGLRTHFQDFVDNHWTALWFGLYELKKELMPDCPEGKTLYNFSYVRRNSKLDSTEITPNCLKLLPPKTNPVPPEPVLERIMEVSEYTQEDVCNQKAIKQLQTISDERAREKAYLRIVEKDIASRKAKNEHMRQKWEQEKENVELINQKNVKQYENDLQSDDAYVYILLYVSDTKADSFRGVYPGTETITIDLRKALPSVLLRPCAQHGWTVRRIGVLSDLSDGVACILRLRVDLVSTMMGNGSLVSQSNFFPSAEYDDGYRILLGREAPAGFGVPDKKYERDLPSLFPFGTIQHFVEKDSNTV